MWYLSVVVKIVIAVRTPSAQIGRLPEWKRGRLYPQLQPLHASEENSNILMQVKTGNKHIQAL